jgi:HAMP domain-containing protein
MFASIKSKVIVFTLVPLLLTLVIVGMLAVINKQENEKDLILNRLATFRTLLESGDLSFESLKDVERVEVLINEKVSYAALIKKDGSVLYETNTLPPHKRTDLIQAHINEAFEGFEAVHMVQEDGRPILVYISPIIVNGKIVAVLRIDLANEQTAARVQQFTIIVFGIVAASLFFCYFLIAVLITRTVIDNILRLKEATLTIEGGDFDTPIEKQSQDEIGELAEILDHMRTEIKHSHKELETINKGLEEQVHQRTAELEQKLDELERLNRFMTDREIKMIELKKEIALLKGTKE